MKPCPVVLSPLGLVRLGRCVPMDWIVPRDTSQMGMFSSNIWKKEKEQAVYYPSLPRPCKWVRSRGVQRARKEICTADKSSTYTA